MIRVSLFTGRRRQYTGVKYCMSPGPRTPVVLMQRACTQVTGHSSACRYTCPSLAGVRCTRIFAERSVQVHAYTIRARARARVCVGNLRGR